MAWSWSHSAEGMQAVRDNILRKDREWLLEVFVEWKVFDLHGEDSPLEAYAEETEKAKDIPDDILAEYVAERTETYATCSNGGHEAYCCPYDCLPHTVPFSDEAVEEELAREKADEAERDAEWEAELEEDETEDL